MTTRAEEHIAAWTPPAVPFGRLLATPEQIMEEVAAWSVGKLDSTFRQWFDRATINRDGGRSSRGYDIRPVVTLEALRQLAKDGELVERRAQRRFGYSFRLISYFTTPAIFDSLQERWSGMSLAEIDREVTDCRTEAFARLIDHAGQPQLRRSVGYLPLNAEQVDALLRKLDRDPS